MEDKLHTLRTLLAETEGTVLAYLFGSQARGDAGPVGDLDLAVLVDVPSPELRYRLAGSAGGVRGPHAGQILGLPAGAEASAGGHPGRRAR
jgi:hypothetical protein